MRRYYVNKSEADQVVNRINRQQHKDNWFVNIAIKPYHGKKHDPQNTVVVVVG